MQAISVAPSKRGADRRQVAKMATQRQTAGRSVTMYLLAVREASVRQIR